MKARILPPAEWGRINSPGLPELLPYCEPTNIAVCVVEEGDEVVASVCALRVTHFEGLWIKPEYRGNAGVFRSLIREAYSVPRGRHEKWVVGGAAEEDARMDTLCVRLGGELLPLKFYVMPVEKSHADDTHHAAGCGTSGRSS